MNKPGSFKRDFNIRGWAIAVACAAGVAEVVVKVLPIIIAKAV
jgi:hypothetical protein